MRPLPIEPLAGMPPFVLGVSIVRGAATPVVSTAELLGLDSSPQAPRFVLLSLHERRAVMTVDAVLGVRVLDPGAIGRLPPLLEEVGAGVLERLGTLDGRLLAVLRAAKVVPPEVWESLPHGRA